jgi:hypothetical protein
MRIYPIKTDLNKFCLFTDIFRGSIPGTDEMIFPLASVSRQALGPTQPPVQWVLRGRFPGAKARPGRDADHSPQSSAEVENE